jgi:asparagine synthetase B (glutamine-hydrolysing)
MSAWGLEARVRFLDKEFINSAMSIDPEWKMVLTDTTLAENGKRAHCLFNQIKQIKAVCICDQMRALICRSGLILEGLRSGC